VDFSPWYCFFSGAFVVGRVLLKCDGFEHIPIWLRVSYRWLIDPEYTSGNNIFGIDDYENRQPVEERWASEWEERLSRERDETCGCGHIMEWHMRRYMGLGVDIEEDDGVG
jgi:hypothetical protein